MCLTRRQKCRIVTITSKELCLLSEKPLQITRFGGAFSCPNGGANVSNETPLLQDPQFIADLKDASQSGGAVGRKWGIAKSAVNKWRKRVLEAGGGAPVTAGESETHNADGSASYVRFSERPWGYADYREFIRTCGQDPDDVTFTWGWTSNPAGGFWNKLNNVRPILVAATDSDTVDLPALYAAARAKPRPKVTAKAAERATIVVLADPQIGKTGRRGGTPELLDRMAEKREKLADALKARKPQRTMFADGGDGFENFNSGGNPMFTNDLSLADQMDVYGTEIYSFLNVMQPYGPVDVAAVLSNHTAWRNGKQNLGRPSDDLGLFVHRQVRKVAEAARLGATWHFPSDYDESVAVDVMGTGIGLVHGNQFGPGQAISWWEKQAFGAQAVTTADVLITAHYHTFGAGVAGRNPANGRQRFWIGAPTLDNGSDWFRQTAGRDSDPGLLIFDVTADGFDLSSLTIL